MRPDEQWAALCVEKALRVKVRPHDDGSQPSMHDFDFRLTNGQLAAVEVTAAADPVAIELWKLVNAEGRWTLPDLYGGWIIELRPGARAKVLRDRLPPLLKGLELARVREVGCAWGTTNLREALQELSVDHATQSGTDYPGSVYFTIQLDPERMGGAVSEDANALTLWASDWLAQPAQAHNRQKLALSGAEERHLFVILPGFNVAPFQVMWPLMSDDVRLPAIELYMPLEITHLWLASTWASGHGIRWSPDKGWLKFEKVDR